eukprot:g27226.t1
MHSDCYMCYPLEVLQKPSRPCLRTPHGSVSSIRELCHSQDNIHHQSLRKGPSYHLPLRHMTGQHKTIPPDQGPKEQSPTNESCQPIRGWQLLNNMVMWLLPGKHPLEVKAICRILDQ